LCLLGFAAVHIERKILVPQETTRGHHE
jgi:hypothetical protein